MIPPSTSYGSLGPGVEEDDFDRLEFNPSDYVQEVERSATSHQHSSFTKPLTLATGLIIVSVAAFTISQYSGLSQKVTSSASLDQINRPVFANLEDYEKEALFRTFVEDYEKKYKTDEYQTKLETFKEFLVLCDARNMAEANNGGTAIHGITQFADLQDVEFQKYLGYAESSATSSVLQGSAETYSGTDTSVDWSSTYATAVQDQGYCMSSWAFASGQQVESDSIRTLGFTTSFTLSMQQLVSCDSTDGGCNGGDPEQALEYVKENGLVYSSSYPYSSTTGESGTCDSTQTDYKISINEYYTLAGTDSTTVENNMINYVMTTGPLMVCVDASTWSSYESGIISVCTTNVNHCVQAVGVDTSAGSWKLRNSWGTTYGESGYVYIKTGENLCGITTVPLYTAPYKYGVTDAPTFTPTLPPTDAPTEAPTGAPIAAQDDDWDDNAVADTTDTTDAAADDDWDDNAASAASPEITESAATTEATTTESAATTDATTTESAATTDATTTESAATTDATTTDASVVENPTETTDASSAGKPSGLSLSSGLVSSGLSTSASVDTASSDKASSSSFVVTTADGDEGVVDGSDSKPNAAGSESSSSSTSSSFVSLAPNPSLRK